jgi:NitT/TauT family transport system permease protein
MSKVQDAATSAALTTAVLQAPSRHPSKHLRAWLETGLGTSLLQFVAVAVFFLCWEVATELGWLSEFLMGKPSGIWARFVSSLMDGSLLINTGYTLWEAVLGFVIGTALGTVMGLSLWYSKWVEQLVGPFIAAINSVPKIALAPIVLLWFGTGLLSKVVLVVSMTAIVALIAAHQAAKDADKDLQALMFSMGGNKHQIFFGVVVPASLPAILATFRINVGFGLVGAVVGEFISSKYGLGNMIYTASSLFELNTVWVGLFMLMLVGFILYHAIDALERVALPWRTDGGRPHLQM